MFYKQIKPKLKYRICWWATIVYDWQIPIISWLANKVRNLSIYDDYWD